MECPEFEKMFLDWQRNMVLKTSSSIVIVKTRRIEIV